MHLVQRLSIAALTAAAVMALAGCASTTAAAKQTSDSEPPFLVALHKCDLTPATPGVEYADKGKTLILSTVGNDTEQYLLDWDNVQCVLKSVKASTATLNEIQETRALDGRQKKSWTGVDASWTYHPDDGLNVTLEQTE